MPAVPVAISLRHIILYFVIMPIEVGTDINKKCGRKNGFHILGKISKSLSGDVST